MRTSAPLFLPRPGGWRPATRPRRHPAPRRSRTGIRARRSRTTRRTTCRRPRGPRTCRRRGTNRERRPARRPRRSASIARAKSRSFTASNWSRTTSMSLRAIGASIPAARSPRRRIARCAPWSSGSPRRRSTSRAIGSPRSGRGCWCCSGSRLTTPRPRRTASPTRSRSSGSSTTTEGRMNEPLGDREVLCVSQFTLYGDTRKGNRPSYVKAAPGDVAEPLYDRVCERLGAKKGVVRRVHGGRARQRRPGDRLDRGLRAALRPACGSPDRGYTRLRTFLHRRGDERWAQARLFLGTKPGENRHEDTYG